jgi:hypothetical protein
LIGSTADDFPLFAGGTASDLKAEVAPLFWEKADIGGEGKRILGACQPRKRPLCQGGEASRKRASF